MSSSTSAIVVARPGSVDLAVTLGAVAVQTELPDRVVVAVTGADPSLESKVHDVLGDIVPWHVVQVPGSRNLGDAVRRAFRDRTLAESVVGSRWMWLLHEDSVPEPDCLHEQLRVASEGRTIGVVGAKQLSGDGRHLLEVGIQATRSARRLTQIAPDEIDQGQYDGTSDVLAVGTAGMLVSTSTWRATGGTDPALGPFGDGLEFCRRVRRAGERVVVAPKAKIRHERRSLYGQRTGAETPDASRSFAARRYAQIYNWMLAAPWWQVPIIAVAMVVWAPLRALWKLLRGRRDLAAGEIRGWLKAVVRTPAAIRGRVRLTRQATVPASALASLETTPAELSTMARRERKVRRLEQSEGQPTFADRLREEGSIVWFPAVVCVVLAAASLIVLRPFLEGIRGAAWAEAPQSWWTLWHQAWSAWVPGGDGFAGAPDAMVPVVALVTAPFALLGVAPSTVMTGILLLAVPLAFATGWLAARVVSQSRARACAAALLWAFAPALLASMAQGRLSSILFHVALPLVAHGWLSIARTVDPKSSLDPHRMPGWGGAGLALAVCVACVPWTLLPAAIAAVLLVVALPAGARRPASGVFLSLVPGAVLLVPTVATVLMHGLRSLDALLAPGGPASAFTPAASWQVLAGIPVSPGSDAIHLFAIAPAVVVLVAYLGAFALAPADRCGRLGLAGIGAGLAGAIGVILQHIDVAATDVVVRAWAGPACSLLWLILILATLWAWEGVAMAHRATRIAVVAVAGAALAAMAIPVVVPGGSQSADPRIEAFSRSEVPAIGLQAQESERRTKSLVLNAGDQSTRAAVLAGRQALITDTSAVRNELETGNSEDPASREHLLDTLSRLLSFPDEDAVAALASHGIDTITLEKDGAPADAAEAALNRAPGLEVIGAIEGRAMWRVRPEGAAPSAVRLQSADSAEDAPLAVPSTPRGVDSDVDAAGRTSVVLAAQADPQWSATFDGQALEPVTVDGWAQGFALPDDAGTGHLVVTQRHPWSMWWWIAAGIGLAASAVFAFPGRRRA